MSVSRNPDFISMPSSRLLAALTIILAGLAGRALIDKLLATTGGPVAVAAWAQTMGLADLISGVSLTGIGIALTVRVAAANDAERLVWLKAGLLTGTVLATVVALPAAPVLQTTAPALLPADPGLAGWALATGMLLTPPGVLVAWFVGLGRLGPAAGLAILQAATPLVFNLVGITGDPLKDLLAGYAGFGLLTLLACFAHLHGRVSSCQMQCAVLLRFVPAGLTVGLCGPAATLLARAEIAHILSWPMVGQIQAIWRSSEWITATTAGVLNALFLPRLAAAPNAALFQTELRRAANTVLLPAAILLLLLWLFLPETIALLYREDMRLPRHDVAMFLFGDWLRILAWVPLFGLFARQATRAVSLGEFLSLPLFAGLLLGLSPSLDPFSIGTCWAVAYMCYGLFNFLALRGTRPRAVR